MAKRRKALASLSEALVESMRNIRPVDDGNLATIQLRWTEYVGPKLAQHVVPVGIDGDVLLLAATDPLWKQAFGDVSASLFRRIRHELPSVKKHGWARSAAATRPQASPREAMRLDSLQTHTASQTIEEALTRLQSAKAAKEQKQ